MIKSSVRLRKYEVEAKAKVEKKLNLSLTLIFHALNFDI